MSARTDRSPPDLTQRSENSQHFKRKKIYIFVTVRVRPELAAFTADSLAAGVTSCDQLTHLYNSYKIVATTCLATDHAAIVNRTFDWCIIGKRVKL